MKPPQACGKCHSTGGKPDQFWLSINHKTPLLKGSSHLKDNGLAIYWVGQKAHMGFSITVYGKTRTNSLANPTHRYRPAMSRALILQGLTATADPAAAL